LRSMRRKGKGHGGEVVQKEHQQVENPYIEKSHSGGTSFLVKKGKGKTKPL